MLSNDDDEWEIEYPQDLTWDVVIVGSGMGGSTMAYALTQKGHNVLVIEKGSLLHKELPAGKGIQPKDAAKSGGEPTGQWPHKLAFHSNLGDGQLHASLGCGSGGSTISYGATLERLAPIDFSPRQFFAETPGADLPEEWPVNFEEMLPYYRQAEQLFRVRGTPDPIYGVDEDSLMMPPELNSKDKALFAHLRARGLQPYRMHIASEFHPECQYCPGVCPKACRNDAAKICLVPALKTGRAKFLGNCSVTRVDANESATELLVCERNGVTLRIKAKIFVLAAGAYGSALILLNSVSADWPTGLANRSGLVGRNLMMHTTDFFATWPKGMGNRRDFSRSVALRDLYVVDGVKLGMIQSSGVRANRGLVQQFLGDYCDRHPAWWTRLARPLMPPVAVMGAFLFNRAVIMATILEDVPYNMNRVLPDSAAPGGFRVEYHYRDELKERNELMREKIKERFGRNRVAFLLERKNNLNFGHPCGTCRFGDDPNISVLDKNNKAHGLENLYVTDASFFPSSAGVNPSLTIAANALRVAEVISLRLSQRKPGPSGAPGQIHFG